MGILSAEFFQTFQAFFHAYTFAFVLTLGSCYISLLTGKVSLKSHFTHINRRSLSVGTTEGSASVELTNKGSVESCYCLKVPSVDHYN